MAQPTGSTFIGEVATTTKDRISLPVDGIRELGWAPGERLLVQRLTEDFVLLIRDPNKSTGQISDETYEEPTDAEDEAETIHGGVALDSPEVAMTDTAAEEPLVNGQPMARRTASAFALLDRLEQRIVALEQLLANEPADAETAGPAAEQSESMTSGEDVGPEAAGPPEPRGDGMAKDEATSLEALGAVESNIWGEDERPGEEMDAAVPGLAEAEAGDAETDATDSEDSEVEAAEAEEAAWPVEEPAPITAAAEEPGDQTGGQSVERDTVGAGVGAAAGPTAGVDAGLASGVGAGHQARVVLQAFGELLGQMVPEETMGHLEAGRREGLLALRSLFAAGIEWVDTMQDAGAAAKGAQDRS
jgi:hypothetical protein